MSAGSKDPSAFLTIGELADELGLPQHILRYWETRFSQLKPLQRAGNRRYYRPADAKLARQINQWLNVEGYTVKGVQKMLASDGALTETAPPAPAATPSIRPADTTGAARELVRGLVEIRDRLARAIAEDDRAS